MSGFLDAGLVLLVLLGSAALGGVARPLLSERHLSREVIEFVQLVIAMLVTFAALVLGLLTSSVKSSRFWWRHSGLFSQRLFLIGKQWTVCGVCT